MWCKTKQEAGPPAQSRPFAVRDSFRVLVASAACTGRAFGASRVREMIVRRDASSGDRIRLIALRKWRRLRQRGRLSRLLELSSCRQARSGFFRSSWISTCEGSARIWIGAGKAKLAAQGRGRKDKRNVLKIALSQSPWNRISDNAVHPLRAKCQRLPPKTHAPRRHPHRQPELSLRRRRWNREYPSG